jgi:O-methyltransferase involved in polyketide biosynthesis
VRPVSEEDLAVLQADYPVYRIWREITPGRDRYVVRSLLPGLSPHTVVTDDLGELRDLLQPAGGPELAAFTTATANIARMYAHWLGGKDSFEADRAAADAILTLFPEVADVARANRAFLARAVRHVARQGVRQFIDLGAGLPATPNVHEIAREKVPDARVVYLDRDPVVLTHARALLAVDDNIGVVAGDIRDPARALASLALARVIDAGEPVCVLLGSVLHFLAADEADEAVAAFRAWMAPGSYLIISAGTSTGTDPELLRQLQAAYAGTAPVTARTAAEITAWFGGLTLARPGVVDVWAWRPDSILQPAQSRARMLVGVGRKPAAGSGWPI